MSHHLNLTSRLKVLAEELVVAIDQGNVERQEEIEDEIFEIEESLMHEDGDEYDSKHKAQWR